jgi:hypothetical protein
MTNAHMKEQLEGEKQEKLDDELEAHHRAESRWEEQEASKVAKQEQDEWLELLKEAGAAAKAADKKTKAAARAALRADKVG